MRLIQAPSEKRKLIVRYKGLCRQEPEIGSVMLWGLFAIMFFVCFLHCTFPSNWPIVDTVPYMSSSIVFFSCFPEFSVSSTGAAPLAEQGRNDGCPGHSSQCRDKHNR